MRLLFKSCLSTHTEPKHGPAHTETRHQGFRVCAQKRSGPKGSGSCELTPDLAGYSLKQIRWFPKIRGTDYSVLGSILGSPYFGKLPFRACVRERSGPRGPLFVPTHPRSHACCTSPNLPCRPSTPPPFHLRWILKILHDPNFLIPWELWFYCVLRSCRIYSINSRV